MSKQSVGSAAIYAILVCFKLSQEAYWRVQDIKDLVERIYFCLSEFQTWISQDLTWLVKLK